jgi:hypothetical protein
MGDEREGRGQKAGRLNERKVERERVGHEIRFSALRSYFSVLRMGVYAYTGSG